jgi:hypothetical protein
MKKPSTQYNFWELLFVTGATFYFRQSNTLGSSQLYSLN